MSGERRFSVGDHGFSFENAAMGGQPRGLLGFELGMFSFVACAIVARRAAGALSHPLALLPLVAAIAVLVAASAFLRVGIVRQRVSASLAWYDWMAMAWISAAVLFSAAALCLPGTPETAVVLVGFLVATEEACSWVLLLRRLAPCDSQSETNDQSETSDTKAAGEMADETTPDDVVQQMTRRRGDDGAETISGCVRVPFAAGQRTASAHLAFCPPFDAIPNLEFEQVEGPEASIKASQTLAYGARLDLKLAEPAEEPCSVTVQFFAAGAY